MWMSSAPYKSTAPRKQSSGSTASEGGGNGVAQDHSATSTDSTGAGSSSPASSSAQTDRCMPQPSAAGNGPQRLSNPSSQASVGGSSGARRTSGNVSNPPSDTSLMDDVDQLMQQTKSIFSQLARELSQSSSPQQQYAYPVSVGVASGGSSGNFRPSLRSSASAKRHDLDAVVAQLEGVSSDSQLQFMSPGTRRKREQQGMEAGSGGNSGAGMGRAGAGATVGLTVTHAVSTPAEGSGEGVSGMSGFPVRSVLIPFLGLLALHDGRTCC